MVATEKVRSCNRVTQLSEVEQTGQGKDRSVRGYQELHFGWVKFEMSLGHLVVLLFKQLDI